MDKNFTRTETCLALADDREAAWEKVYEFFRVQYPSEVMIEVDLAITIGADGM